MNRLLIAQFTVFYSFSVMAQLPSGGSVVSGQAAITGGAGVLNINQSSQQAIINWQSFSIGAGQMARFAMPNGGSVLNRVTGSDVSAIMGSLQANGNVFLINPHGVLIGNGARINVGSLTASTLDLSNRDFINGGSLNFHGDSAASVQNFGEITSLGDVFLIGRNVSNAGTIKGTHVGLAAGSSVELRQLDPENPGLERITVHASGDEEPSLIGTENKTGGVIEATTAELKAAGGNIYALAVNNGGIVRANSVVKEKGRIFLKSAGGTVINSGTLDASGKDTGTQGGGIQVLGKNVGLVGDSVIDASGDAGGGEILIGGDYQGKNPVVLNAENTVMTSGASINASATRQGVGGRVILWSDYTTKFLGEIEARGGAAWGDGGFVETSGKDTLVAMGSVNVGASNGQGGQWLLDPRNITITAAATSGGTYDDSSATREVATHEWDERYNIGFDFYSNPKDFFSPNNDDSVVMVGSIQDALNSGSSVTITTEDVTPGDGTGSQAGNITITTSIDKTAHAADDSVATRLELLAHNNIYVNAAITSEADDPLYVSLGAGNNIEINAEISGLKILSLWRYGDYSDEIGEFGIIDRDELLRQVDVNAPISADYVNIASLKTYINTPKITGTKEFNLQGDLILQQDFTIAGKQVMVGEGHTSSSSGNKFNYTIDNLSTGTEGLTLMGSPTYPGFKLHQLNNFTQKNGSLVGLGYGTIDIEGEFSLGGSLMVPFHVDINAGSKNAFSRLIVTKALAMSLGASEELADKIAASEQTVTINTSAGSDPAPSNQRRKNKRRERQESQLSEGAEESVPTTN